MLNWAVQKRSGAQPGLCWWRLCLHIHFLGPLRSWYLSAGGSVSWARPPPSSHFPRSAASRPSSTEEGPLTPANFGRKCLEFRFRFREWTVIFFFFFFSPILHFQTNFHFHVRSGSSVTTVPDRTAATTMASSPQKSPSSPKSSTPKSPSSRKKDDSFLGKLGGTLARRKKAKEGKTACENNGRKTSRKAGG